MKRIIKEKLLCFIYIFIIFVSMYPNKTNSKNVAKFQTILPEIQKIYNKDKNNEKCNYTLKSIEISKKVFKK